MREMDFRDDVLPLKDKLYRLAYQIVWDTAEAEDIAQEVMIRVWGKRDEWAQLGSLEAYCLAAARNLSLDRKARKESHHAVLEPEACGRADESADPHARLVGKERMVLLRRFLRQLPEKQRTALMLREVEEMSYKEIADALRCTEAQVKVTLFRARQKLKQWFEEIEGYGL